MTNIAEQVGTYLDNDFIIRKCLFNNIISLRALSRHLIKNLHLSEKNMDAIMSAIRRYKRDNKIEELNRLKRVFADIVIKTKDNIADVYIPKNKEMQEKLNNFSSKIDLEKGEVLRIIQAEQGIRVILDEKNLNFLSDIFAKKDIRSINKGLAEVIINFFPDAVKTPGIISIVSSSLTSANICIHEIMSSAPELIIIISDKDLIKALHVLENLRSMY